MEICWGSAKKQVLGSPFLFTTPIQTRSDRNGVPGQREVLTSPKMSVSLSSRIFNSTSRVILASILLRLGLLLYGIYHDAHSPLKYTDVDYFVFTDAARYINAKQSPYNRETYRYTPLLAWL